MVEPQIPDEPTLVLTVAGKRMDGDSVVVLTLRSTTGQPLPAWSPGSHIDIALSPEMTRQYSLCGDASDPYVWQIAVLHEPPPIGRGGSNYIYKSLAVGDVVEARGPRNHFALQEARDYLFIAGGIGITPLRSMIDSVSVVTSKWRLVYVGRSLTTMALRKELAQYGDHIRYFPSTETGRVDLDELLATPIEDCLVYCCGPAGLIQAVEDRCDAWPVGALHVERFVPRAQDARAINNTFEVELAQSGQSLTVPADKSILEILENNGFSVLSSCRSGICGTCETDVLEGTPEHRDSVLSDEERAANETMMVCVSRCVGQRLVLDL